MGIYLGNGWFIHSSGYGVAVATLSGWYEQRFAWGRRPLAEAGLVSPVSRYSPKSPDRGIRASAPAAKESARLASIMGRSSDVAVEAKADCPRS